VRLQESLITGPIRCNSQPRACGHRKEGAELSSATLRSLERVWTVSRGAESTQAPRVISGDQGGGRFKYRRFAWPSCAPLLDVSAHNGVLHSRSPDWLSPAQSTKHIPALVRLQDVSYCEHQLLTSTVAQPFVTWLLLLKQNVICWHWRFSFRAEVTSAWPHVLTFVKQQEKQEVEGKTNRVLSFRFEYLTQKETKLQYVCIRKTYPSDRSWRTIQLRRRGSHTVYTRPVQRVDRDRPVDRGTIFGGSHWPIWKLDMTSM
jgi:hypothetical protein